MSNHNLFIHGANGASEPATTEQILAAARQVSGKIFRRRSKVRTQCGVLECYTITCVR
jgi:hypothetical protein